MDDSTRIVDQLYDSLYPNYIIDKSLLYHWQSESEKYDTFEEFVTFITSEIIIANTDTRPDSEKISQLFKIDNIDHELKVIVYQILINVIESNIGLKIELFELDILDHFINEFLNQLSNDDILHQLNELSLVNQYFQLILSFCQFGCKTTTFKNLLLPILSKNIGVSNLIIMQLMNQMLQTENFPFILFTKQFNFPFQNEIKNTFTIYSWFKIKLEEDTIPLFTISSSLSEKTCDTSLSVSLYGKKFMIEIKNNVNGSRIQLVFNQIITSSEFIQFALTYDNTNLNLYVNGEYSESIPCPNLHKYFKTWNKLSLNDGANELMIRNFTLLNENLSFEWINTLFNLGIRYDWDYKEFNHDTLKHLLNQMSYEKLFTTSVKINEFETLKQLNSNKSLKKNPNSQSGLMNRNYIIKSLKPIQDDVVLFDSNHYLQHLIANNQKGTRSMKYHNPNTLFSIIDLLGGPMIMLKLLESSLEVKDNQLRDCLLYKSLELLLNLLNINWRSCKEFENINGYGILSLLLQKYKIINPSLKLDVYENFKNSNCDLLYMLLNHCGHEHNNLYESKIANAMCYKILILNLDLFNQTESFDYLLFQIQLLLSNSKYKDYNYNELKQLRLLKKLIHFLKNNKEEFKESTKVQLSQTLTCIIRSDASVDAIMTLSSYIIYALYNPETSTDSGVIALQVLTDCLCDATTSIKTLKKFSRSITVHWILLLFNNQDESVVNCGIKLLTRLLQTLGTHIMKKFFHLNHGLDILTSSLKDWWNSDRILCTIFLSSFGIDSTVSDYENNLIEILNLIDQSNQLILPEFILLLNNLVINSWCTLSSASGKSLSSNPSTPNREERENITLILNVVHLMNQYTESLRIGFEKLPVLHKLYQTKPFLEGLVEILGYLKISMTWCDNSNVRNSIKTSFENLSNVIAGFYISNDQFLSTFNELSDFTKLTLSDLIFPLVLHHVNQFINVSNFVFNEKQIINNTIQILNYYNFELIQKHYWVSYENLNTFVLSSITLVENGNGNLISLKQNLGNVIVLIFLRLSCDCEYMLEECKRNLNNILKELLYRQITIFNQEILSNKQIGIIIKVILGILIKEEHPDTEMPFNFFRTTYLLRQVEGLEQILNEVNLDRALMDEFFQNLITKNDEETLNRLIKYAPFVKSITKEFQLSREPFSKIEYSKVSNIISLTLNNGGKLSQLNNVYIRSFEKDCETIKNSTMNNESVKYNRFMQDNEESIKYCISVYHVLKYEITRLFDTDYSPSYLLDYIENSDRMRRRMIMEDQLPESEKLTYNIDIPLQKIDTFSESEYDYITGVDTLTLGDDNYELIKKNDDEVPELEDGTTFEDRNRKVSRSLFVGDQIVALWNISQINGLVPVESLLILGVNYIYLIENYFLSKDGNVVDVDDAPEDLRDPVLQLVNSQSSSILKNNEKSHRNKNWSLDNLSCISKRHFLLRDNALELFFNDGASVLITCLSQKERDVVFAKLSSYATGKGIDSDLSYALQGNDGSFSSKLASAFVQPSPFLHATKRWKQGELSNFYYLMIINTLAGRTFNDLTQYPVFPWVIADYASETLDLSDPSTFRDLSKPMGGQTSIRANQFHERFEALHSLNDANSPAFHYGTHYSSAMIVTSYLIRLKPYVQSYLLLQGGKFDHADRLFNSIEKAWNSASRDNTTDVRELTPEFFYLPEFLINSNNFKLGKLQNGSTSNDVELPAWAKNDPKIFIDKNREALESSYVSANLHLWIDLVFGYKQDGPEAITSLNVFHHLSYNGAINLDHINDETEKRAVIGMINNFGQTPKKVFHKPHVQKDVLNLPNLYLTKLSNKSAGLKLVFESKLKKPIVKLERSMKYSERWVGRQACISCEDDLLIRKYKTSNKFFSGSLIINNVTFLDIHSNDITSILQVGNKIVVTGCETGLINVWKCEVKPKVSLHYVSVLRGHLTQISNIVYTNSFKIGASLDIDGNVILWDFTRFKFIRKITPLNTPNRSLIAISNDSGSLALVHEYENETILQLYTINGEPILKQTVDSVPSVVGFGSTNINKSSTMNNHEYWTNEIVAIATKKSIEIMELIPDSPWCLKTLEIIDLSNDLAGDITSFAIFKASDIDSEDKLIRGILKLVIGDSTGKVYTI